MNGITSNFPGQFSYRRRSPTLRVYVTNEVTAVKTKIDPLPVPCVKKKLKKVFDSSVRYIGDVFEFRTSGA